MIPLREIKMNSLVVVSQPRGQSWKRSWEDEWAISCPSTELTVHSMNLAMEGAGLQVGEGEIKCNGGSCERAHLSPAVIQNHIFMTKA